MRVWSKDSLYLIILDVCLIIASIVYTSLYFIYDLNPWLLVTIPLIITSTLFLNQWSGIVVTLGFTAYLFTIKDAIELDTLIIFLLTVTMLITTALSYLLNHRLYTYQLAQREAEVKVRQLIAIDPETLFDNSDRFRLDVETERDRLIRHGGSFSVSIIHLNEFVDFEKLYGQTEYEWFLNYFSDELHMATRRTDQKYRIAIDAFAIIFPYTSPESAQVVHERIRPLLEQYELQSGEHVALTYEDTFYEVTRENCNSVVNEIFAKVSLINDGRIDKKEP